MIHASDYLLFRTCPRSLHLKLSGQSLPVRFPADEQFPVPSDRAIVQDLLRTRFPGGRQPSEPLGADPAAGADARTQVLFRACCGIEPFLACADVLHPQKPDGVAAVLARETTSVKESHLTEAAFLLWCFMECNVPLQKIYIYHLQKNYESEGDIDPDTLYAVRDVSRRAEKQLEVERGSMENLRSLLEHDPLLEQFRDAPCGRPQRCPVCATQGQTPAMGDLSTLHKGGKLAGELREEGYRLLQDVPETRLSDRRHRIQRSSLRSGKPHTDQQRLRGFLESLEYPLHYLDFEATSEAVPRFARIRPWEHIAYLFSLHRQESPGATASHIDFIMAPGRDERRAMADELISAVGERGNIVVYSAGFEKGILTRLAQALPERADALQELISRVVDLLDPFSQFAYYHCAQEGKLSLKRVLPLLTGQTYADESVADGYTANVAYRYLTHHPHLSPEERESILGDLRSYCRMDTQAMVAIVDQLHALLLE